MEYKQGMSTKELWLEQMIKGCPFMMLDFPFTRIKIPEKNNQSFTNTLITLNAAGNRSFL